MKRMKKKRTWKRKTKMVELNGSRDRGKARWWRRIQRKRVKKGREEICECRRIKEKQKKNKMKEEKKKNEDEKTKEKERKKKKDGEE